MQNVRLRTEGDLIAAIPHLLSFKPAESIVVCVHNGPSGAEIAVCLRSDIPPPDQYRSLAEQLKLPVLRANACSATVVVVSRSEEPLPHRELVDTLKEVFHPAGVAIHQALWTPEIKEGAKWLCYTSQDCHGQVPDPDATQLAAVAAVAGSVTFDSRDQLRATLEPVDRRPLASRAERIEAALSFHPDEERARKLIDDVIADVREDTLVLDDDRIVDLAVALTHVRVRDGCLRPEVTSLGVSMERLWADLTRALPVPYRAEPACLLAVTSYLRGDGVTAGIAVDAAIEANPQHAAAYLLRYAMDMGLPPAAVGGAIAKVFAAPPKMPANSCPDPT